MRDACRVIIIVTTVATSLFSCMLGYTPDHHCCNLAGQDNGAFIAHGLPVSVLMPCCRDNFPFIILLTTVVTWLFRRTGRCTWSTTVDPYALFYHFPFIILLTTVV